MMAVLKFELKDCNGKDTEIGEEIEVTFPEIQLEDHYDRGGEVYYYRPQTTARAKVLCSPSKGLQLKILEVIDTQSQEEYLDIADAYYETGRKIGFRYTVWNWQKRQADKK